MINQYKGSRSIYWNTPKEMYNKIMKEFKDYNPENSLIDPFYLDTKKYYDEKVFINPPFNILNKKEWIDTIRNLLINKNKLMLLLPARTDTIQFHKLLKLGFEVYFIKGRLNYNDQGPAPFPSIIMYKGITRSYIKELIK